MITRRRFLAGAGSVGALGVALRARGAAAAAGDTIPRAAAASAGVVLKIVQATAATPPASGVDAPLLWRLGPWEFLDPRELQARLAHWPGARIHAVVGGANHLLLLDALRRHGGTVQRQRWSPAEQRWTVSARAGRVPREPARPG
jgi:hypothetical protein